MPISYTLTARWIFPVTGPPLERGTVTVCDGWIEAVEPCGVRTADEDLGNVAIIPGLVNAHTHLDLSGASGRIPPTEPHQFTSWLRGVIAFRRSRTPAQVQADIQAGLAECLRHGTTVIGDIAAEGASWDILAAAPTRAVVFHELIGLSQTRADEALQTALRWIETGRRGTTTCQPGLSPHAPYSWRVDRLSSQSGAGSVVGQRLTIHLAEAPGELELLENRSGEFVTFLRDIGAWDPSGLAVSPEQILELTHEVAHALYAHCNYLSPTVTFHRNQSIVYCPRTHAAFHHPPHPFREFLARGVRVCLGTDSLASNADLDILAEARYLRQQYPDFPGDQLLRMVTLAGAEALGWDQVCGSLDVGKSADLVAVPLPDWDLANPYNLLLSDVAGQRRTMFRGVWRPGSEL